MALTRSKHDGGIIFEWIQKFLHFISDFLSFRLYGAVGYGRLKPDSATIRKYMLRCLQGSQFCFNPFYNRGTTIRVKYLVPSRVSVRCKPAWRVLVTK